MPPKLQSLLDDLAMFSDPEDRKLYFIDLARSYIHPSEVDVPRTSESRVPGCESQVYFKASGGHFLFAVEDKQAIMARALASILAEAVEGRLAEDLPVDLPHMIFGDLSVGRTMGLTNMVSMVRQAAKSS